jgi:hypothetical protein
MPTTPTQQIPASSIGVNVQGNMSGTAGLWAFAILWNAVSGLFFYIAALNPRGPLWVIAIFPGIGVFLLAFTVYITISRVRWGVPVFDLQNAYAAVGGIVTGAIRLPKPLVYRDAIQLRLACVRGTVHRTANNSTIEENFVVWEDFCALGRFPLGESISEIPVFFKIPGDASPTQAGTADGRLLWRLDAKAKTQGIHFAVSFVVPVSPANGPSPTVFPVDPTIRFRSPELARYQPMDHRIVITPLSGGGNRYEFLAGRSVGVAALLFVIGMFFAGVGVAFIVTSGIRDATGLDFVSSLAPVGIGVFACAIGAIPVALGVYLLLQKTTVIAQHGFITVETSVVAFTRRRELHAADIQDIDVDISGSINDHPIYGVKVTQSGSKPFRLCDGIRNKRDAEWLDGQFKRDIFGAGR